MHGGAVDEELVFGVGEGGGDCFVESLVVAKTGEYYVRGRDCFLQCVGDLCVGVCGGEGFCFCGGAVVDCQGSVEGAFGCEVFGHALALLAVFVQEAQPFPRLGFLLGPCCRGQSKRFVRTLSSLRCSRSGTRKEEEDDIEL